MKSFRTLAVAATIILASCGEATEEPTSAPVTEQPSEMVPDTVSPSVDEQFDIASLEDTPVVRCPRGPSTPEVMGDHLVITNLDELSGFAKTVDVVVIAQVIGSEPDRDFVFPEEEKEEVSELPAEVFAIRPIGFEVLEQLSGDEQLVAGAELLVSLPEGIDAGDECLDSVPPDRSAEVLFLRAPTAMPGQGLDDLDFVVIRRVGVGGGTVNAYVPQWIENPTLEAFDEMPVTEFIESLRSK